MIFSLFSNVCQCFVGDIEMLSLLTEINSTELKSLPKCLYSFTYAFLKGEAHHDLLKAKFWRNCMYENNQSLEIKLLI